MYEVAVIGCGVIGLTSALAIQQKLKNVRVTIFTKDKSPNTTSDVAAGYWQPYLLGDTSPEKVLAWSKVTYDYILKLWKEGKAREAGICLQPSQYLSDRKDVEIPDWTQNVLGYSKLSRNYLNKIGNLTNRKFVSGFEFMSFTWEASIFLPYLEKKFMKNGGKIVNKNVLNFEELEHYDVIVNCTGLNAKGLTGDTKLGPLRGQVARVLAPWQFHIILIDSEHDRSCYVIPNMNCVILGGTSQPEYNVEVDEVDKKNIFRNCSELVPGLETAVVIKHQVGLRPSRQRVRLEIENKAAGRHGLLRIVHNYGHGGAGITLCVGCAQDCADLVEKALNRTALPSKL